jgi:competence protein ComEA
MVRFVRLMVMLVIVSALNVAMSARPLTQGVQAQDPQAQDPQTPTQTSAKPGSKGNVLNLNTATASDLEELPGIGASIAARIVEYRQKNGGFKKLEDLMNVRGIGEKSFLKLKPYITIAPAKSER